MGVRDVGCGSSETVILPAPMNIGDPPAGGEGSIHVTKYLEYIF